METFTSRGCLPTIQVDLEVDVKTELERDLAKSVGAAIGRMRTQKGMTQDEVASALDIGPEAVSRMERGIVIPSLVRLVEFAELFGCPVESFFNKATGLTGDNAAAIAGLLGPLKRADRQFVLEIIEKACGHLGKR